MCKYTEKFEKTRKKNRKSEKIAYIDSVFASLRVRGDLKTRGEFATLIGISQNSLSAARHGDGRYLTDSLIERVQAVDPSRPAIPHQIAPAAAERSGGIVIPPETLELYTSLARTCDRLSATVDRLLGAVTPAGTGAGQGAKKKPLLS